MKPKRTDAFDTLAMARIPKELDALARQYQGGRSRAIRDGLKMLLAAGPTGTAQTENATN